MRGTYVPAPHLFAAVLCCGLAGSLAVRAGPALLLAGAALLSLGATLTGMRARVVLLAGAFALAGWWWGSARLDALERSPLSAEVGETALMRVEVSGPTRRGRFDLRVPVSVKSFDDRSVDQPAQLELPISVRAPPQGARLELVGRVEEPQPRDDDSGFDEATYLGRRGIHVVVHAERYRIVGRRGGLHGLADALRARLQRSIAPGLEDERRALVAGVVLGEDEGLDDELRDRFRSSGLYHVMAVSGQNVAYVVVGVLVLAWIAGVPRLLAQAAALCAIAGYVAAVGWQPSVVRAGVAGALATLAWLAARPRDRWYFLLVGAAVLLAWNPNSLLDPGFQLSFAAVAGIFTIVPRLERVLAGYPVPRPAAILLSVAVACSLVTAPIVWLQFGTVPVFSVLANAIGGPVVAPILGFGLGAAMLEPILPPAAEALAWANGWLAAYLAWCARTVGGFPFAQVGSAWALGGLAAAGGLVVALVRARRAWRRPLALAGATLAAGIATWALWPEGGSALPPPVGLRVSFLDVGQGDAILLEAPGAAVLVDQGPPEADVAEQLLRLGVRELSAVVLTHPQRDHVGGAAEVIRRLKVRSILDPALPTDSPFQEEAVKAAADRDTPIVAAHAGQRFRVGELFLDVLWPRSAGARGVDPNRYAVVLRATYGTVDVLLTADAESDVTGALPLRPVEIVKVAHHGSADEGLPRLLATLRPRLAVISVGAGNDYGHPAPSTVAALAQAPGTRVYRTDRDGRIVVESDGRAISVRSER